MSVVRGLYGAAEQARTRLTCEKFGMLLREWGEESHKALTATWSQLQAHGPICTYVFLFPGYNF